MRLIAIIILALSPMINYAQEVLDFKAKNESNTRERTYMLDLIRSELYKSEKIEMKFVVEHFKVSAEYAWFEGTAQRKDDKPLVFPSDRMGDCCKVYCLFNKIDNRWTIERFLPFCMDVCYWGIGNQYPAPSSIFPKNDAYFAE